MEWKVSTGSLLLVHYLFQKRIPDFLIILLVACLLSLILSVCLPVCLFLTLSGIFDTVLSRLGELCLYLMVLVATPFIATQIITNQTGQVVQNTTHENYLRYV